jgi:hypothetical protein
VMNNGPPPKVSKLRQRISYVVMNVVSFYYSDAAGMAPRPEAIPLGSATWLPESTPTGSQS